MSGLFNLIKNLFAGIFGFIGGLLGGKKAIEGSTPKKAKKSNGYFLELDESGVGSAKPASATPVETPTAEQPMTVSQETVAEAAQADPVPAKKSTRKEKLAALAAADKPATNSDTAPAAAPQPAPAAVAVAAIKPETNFATKYLIPANNGGRRRPGANMSSYLDMARKMNAS
ncbi:MAG: hypothetical protein IGS48_20140 [Oscillatoriales cyanobacterium C42_A2020_001]|nr:hypothetical protein [Leptolyngbyaceae cyanobacterium C42_A2020_001]